MLGSALNFPQRRAAAVDVAPRGERVADDATAPSLTARHWQIVELAAKGHTDREIADRLYVAPGTIKVYLSRDIYPAFGLRGSWGNHRVRLALAVEARKAKAANHEPVAE